MKKEKLITRTVHMAIPENGEKLLQKTFEEASWTPDIDAFIQFLFSVGLDTYTRQRQEEAKIREARLAAIAGGYHVRYYL